MTEPLIADAREMREFLAALFAAAGLAPTDAETVADAILEADLSGRGSHGVQLADLYLERLCNGTMSTASNPQIISENGGSVVLDAAEMEGHLSAQRAIEIAVAKARDFGVAAVAMRGGFHFGVLGRYVRIAAEQGCAAIAMCNTKPLMAAPGGAERLLGTNPLAVAFPVEGETPVVFDMATTAGAMGTIRQYLAAGEAIPENWATDDNGKATTDPAEALAGLLLPAAGAKGFGLAFVIDMLSGALSGGGWGPTMGELRSDKPYNGSSLFITLDIKSFRALDAFMFEARQGVERIRNSKKAEGVLRLYTPGERSAEALAGNNGTIRVMPATALALRTRAEILNVPIPQILKA